MFSLVIFLPSMGFITPFFHHPNFRRAQITEVRGDAVLFPAWDLNGKKQPNREGRANVYSTLIGGNQKSRRFSNQLREVAFVEIPFFTKVFFNIPGGCLGFLKHQLWDVPGRWKFWDQR